ncbi:hypothetical protein [Mucilaginibacter kameinonensis]|uniref:hypothetical protein n=1 Tax=Mucilaginibacter kameinonensis TaxID=452286 RepID=UPI000EF853D5|nr:hypothetical protein [Mucilaginibacter kameinonensis]
MPDDKKITVDVKINSDGQRQLDQYTKAFVNLRNAIADMSKPLNSLSSDLPKLTDAVDKLNTQNLNLTDSGDKVANKISDIVSAFLNWKDVLGLIKKGSELAEGAFTLWEGALSGGLAILAVYGPEIINWAMALFKGKEAIDAAKLSLDSLNKGLSSTDYSHAIENVDMLRIKVGLARKGMIDKSEVVKEYNNTIGQTIGQVKSLDEVETILKNNSADYIKSVMYKAAAMAAVKEAAENQVLAAKEMAKSDEDSISYWDSGLANSNDPEIKKIYKKLAEDNRKKAAKPFEDKANALLANALKFETQWATFDQKSPINRVKKQIEDLKKLTDADVIGSKTFASIQKLQKQLDQLNGVINEPDSNRGLPTGTSVKIHISEEEHSKQKKKIASSRSTAILQAKAIDFAKQIELDKQNYDTELALLNEQFNKKLISQEEYNKKSEELQQKFHLGIGDKIQFFNKNDFAEAQKQMQAMIDARQHEDTMARDQKKVDKALLPGQKLDAEKKLIEDKYTYEINLAAGNAEKIKALEDQKQKDITTLTQQYEQQRKEFALQNAQQVADKAFSIIQNNIKTQSDARVKGLEKDKAAELSNKNLTNTQKKAIEDKYQKKEAAEKVKAFKSEQKASILQAIINGALAVTKATSQTGVLAPFVIPGIIASTALQVATMVAQKPPQYAKGGLHYQSDGRGALLPGYSRTDNTNAYLRSGEAIVVSEAMRNPWARNLVSAINVAHGGRDFSIPNLGRGYAVGGIFTDGGNANRYYNQPVNDVKDLANTLAYQMINNFPPVYVDVKDINNQQNILAQTINRVNL